MAASVPATPGQGGQPHRRDPEPQGGGTHRAADRRAEPEVGRLSGRAVQLCRGSWHGSPTPRPPAPLERRERADAARNRRRVLAAAEELFAARGARDVTMEDIARAAGVGKGTLYRRFPDRSSIAVALLDEHERALQERLLTGPPPLGPGAPPAERLAAFYAAMVELLERHLHLALGAETGPRRFATGAYGFWHAHVRALVVEAGGDRAADRDRLDTLVDVLLAPLAPDLYQHQRDRGRSVADVTAALTHLARATLARPAPGAVDESGFESPTRG
jgi:AcrR family transcriptional regulator